MGEFRSVSLIQTIFTDGRVLPFIDAQDQKSFRTSAFYLKLNPFAMEKWSCVFVHAAFNSAG